MFFFDRYIGQIVPEDNLPSKIELGRFLVQKSRKDLTNRVFNVGSERTINQDILETKNKYKQKLLGQFNLEICKSVAEPNSVKPLIQSINTKLCLNEFEELLNKELFHLELIFHQPHYLLHHNIEKVNVSRAKRIPSRGYQNLASHTEDWIQKSIVSFKPSKVLNEELDLLYDVYENQIVVALIERSLVYLEGRLNELVDIKDFLEGLKKLLEERKFEKGWYKKIERNLSLIGSIYTDKNYNITTDKSMLLSPVRDTIQSMQKRLKALQKYAVYNEVSKRVVQSLMQENDIYLTNVIKNHKHYRYIRELWLSLSKEDNIKTNKELQIYEQEVISGLRSFSKAIITYIIKDLFNYEIIGDYSNWKTSETASCQISLKEDRGVILLSIGNSKIKFVTVANKPSIDINDIPKNTYILFLDDSKSLGKIISISPYDPDSVERVGNIIRGYILNNYIESIETQNRFSFNQSLRAFVKYIERDIPVEFEQGTNTYCFKKIPTKDIYQNTIINNLKRDEIFKSNNPKKQAEILKSMESLISEINDNKNKLLEMLRCQHQDCYSPLTPFDVKQLDYYTECAGCGFTLDKKGNHIIFQNKDSHYENLKPEDWGLDYVDLNIE